MDIVFAPEDEAFRAMRSFIEENVETFGRCRPWRVEQEEAFLAQNSAGWLGRAELAS